MEAVIIDGMAFALPLFIMAIGGIYSEKSGITNLALEGFQGVGAFTGALAVVLIDHFTKFDAQQLFYVALIFAMLGGMAFSIIHAVLCIRFKADQVISGVVINILAIALTTFFTAQINALVFGTPSDRFLLGVSERFTVEGLADLPFLGAFFTNVYPFEVIILVVALFASYLLYKTKFGMRLRASGENPHAVDAAGVDVQKIRYTAVLLSGLFSGLGGICFAYSISAAFSSSIYLGYGFLAIAALIFGNWRIGPTFIACLLFGFARSGGMYLALQMQLSSSYMDLFMTLPYILTLLLLVFFSKSNRAPRALGEIYDKGKR